jgi:hypothetical protein
MSGRLNLSMIWERNMEPVAGKSVRLGTSAGLQSRFLLTILNLDYTLSTVKNWVKECESHHDVCVLTADPPLSNQVLDLGSAASSDIKLRVVSRLQGLYVCLSYCLGNKSNAMLQTTKSNISTMTEGMP